MSTVSRTSRRTRDDRFESVDTASLAAGGEKATGSSSCLIIESNFLRYSEVHRDVAASAAALRAPRTAIAMKFDLSSRNGLCCRLTRSKYAVAACFVNPLPVPVQHRNRRPAQHCPFARSVSGLDHIAKNREFFRSPSRSVVERVGQFKNTSYLHYSKERRPMVTVTGIRPAALIPEPVDLRNSSLSHNERCTSPIRPFLGPLSSTWPR